MKNGLFIHDHKFPVKNGKYYESYGFEKEFFQRYTNIFDSLNVIGRETEENILDNDEEINDVTFTTIDSYKQLFKTKKKEYLKNEIKKSDYVVVRLPSIIGLWCLPVIKKYNKPYLIEVVGDAWESFWSQNSVLKYFAFIVTPLTKREIKNATHVVYVTENYLQKKYPTNGANINISNVNLKNINNDDLLKRIKKYKKIDLNEPIKIGTCASYSYYKGQQNVIKIINKLLENGLDIKYELVGGGDASHLKELSEKLGVTSNIKFLEKMQHNDVLKWMETLDIYIQPSLTEGLPRTVIEAMSKALPIIGSNAGGIPELINKNYIYKREDLNQLVDIILKINSNNLISMSKENFEESKKYLKSKLNNKRNIFFEKFIMEYEDY